MPLSGSLRHCTSLPFVSHHPYSDQGSSRGEDGFVWACCLDYRRNQAVSGMAAGRARDHDVLCCVVLETQQKAAVWAACGSFLCSKDQKVESIQANFPWPQEFCRALWSSPRSVTKAVKYSPEYCSCFSICFMSPELQICSTLFLIPAPVSRNQTHIRVMRFFGLNPATENQTFSPHR